MSVMPRFLTAVFIWVAVLCVGVSSLSAQSGSQSRDYGGLDIQALEAVRNIPFTSIKNCRDLESASDRNLLLPGRVYRMGLPSFANPADAALLCDSLGVRTLVDLRSPTELREDSGLWDDRVYGRFATNVRWGGGTSTYDVAADLSIYGTRSGGSRWFRWRVGRCKNSVVKRARRMLGRETAADPDPDPDPAPGAPRPASRHFVSLMDERKYVVGTARLLPRARLAQLAVTGPAAAASSRARGRTRALLLDYINAGGLPLLNRLMLRMAGGGIRTVLTLLADPQRHPVAFYCTAGKDRTGIVAALVLKVLGATEEEVVEDYAISDNVYAQMGDHTAMVGALQQRDLDPDVFLQAPPKVMQQVLEDITQEYGGVTGYLDHIGFNQEQRNQLIKALTQETKQEQKEN